MQTPHLTKLPWRTENGVKVFDIRTEAVRIEFAPGRLSTLGASTAADDRSHRRRSASTIGENRLPEPFRMHWHGLEVLHFRRRPRRIGIQTAHVDKGEVDVANTAFSFNVKPSGLPSSIATGIGGFMKARQRSLRQCSSMVASLALVLIGPLFARAAAQPGSVATAQLVWENDRMRVTRLSLPPGETFAADARGGSVVVFLTANFDGRMPPAEAEWRDPGTLNLQNRGRLQAEALLIDLKSSTPSFVGVTPPEVARASGMMPPLGAYRGVSAGFPEVTNLIRNDHVSVTKQRYPPDFSVAIDPLHFHPQDAVVIYLRSGYAWSTMGSYGPERVRRGDVRVVPANVLHRLANAGSDSLELLFVVPA